MMDSPDLSPGSSPWDTNRTNRTRSSGGKYESAHFFTPAQIYRGVLYIEEIESAKDSFSKNTKNVCP